MGFTLDSDSYSDFLFARPTFLVGFASIIDWGDTLTEFNRSLTPEIADGLAVKSDWKTVGKDIRRAIEETEIELAA